MGNLILIFLERFCLRALIALILINTACSSQEQEPGMPLPKDELQEQTRVIKNPSTTRGGAEYKELPTEKLLWPLEYHTRVSRGYRISGRRPHVGLDIPAPTGTEILAVSSGRIVYAGQAFRGYGKMILIDHPGSLASLYGHCSKIVVRSGDHVQKGQVIGLVGRTGRASAPHLHFEIRVNRSPVDPLLYYD